MDGTGLEDTLTSDFQPADLQDNTLLCLRRFVALPVMAAPETNEW